ncbi:MAG: hypothetical protein LBI15_12415 [Dysgonamonadaceae bacterium]|jgi:hypothetical protein|nr:hypothetical protein [Dysgonamonadaceae bacterium]
MSKQHTFSILLLILSLSACTQPANREINFDHETEKILRRYSAPKDSLKQQAALFLLEHIHAHYSSEHGILQAIEQEYAKVKQREGYIESYERFISILRDNLFFIGLSDFDKVPDTQIVTARYIIRHIENSFKTRQNAAWTNDIDFQTFLEHILPYRVMDEPLDFDRRRFQRRYSPLISQTQGLHEAAAKILETLPVRHHRSMDREFPHLTSIELSHRTGIGNCVQQAVSEAMVLRSVGIPATVDYVPHWGNYPGMHYAVKIIDGTRDNTFDLSFSDVNFTISADSLPESISAIRYHKSIPKVYRMTWSVQPERVKLNAHLEKTGLFQNLYEKDVTDEYTDTSIFHLQIESTTENIAYLCVFDRNGWIPVAAAPIDNDLAVFEKVGREVVFLPAVFVETDSESGYMQPIGYPFYFTDDGTLVTLSGNENQRQNVTLYSKYPMHSYTAAHVYRMKGGRFQGANSVDFSDAKDLFLIDYYPFYRQEIVIESDEIFRYFRYLPPPGVTYSFAELQFFTRDENNERKVIDGTFFERHETRGANFSLLSDNDLDTYVRGALVKESWLGYDVGEDRTGTDVTRSSAPLTNRRVSTIVFATQNDGNCIIPGFVYELLIWQNNEWKPLGAKEATKDYLKYNDIPENALLWLRCYTRGREERIFTVENGKQIWW